MDKIYEKWCEKLLDTGKGNRLINFKDSQLRTLDILVPNSVDIFKRVSMGEKLSFYDLDEYIRQKKEELIKNNEGEFIDETDKENLSFQENSFKFTKNQIVSDLSGQLAKRQILAYKPGQNLEKILANLRKKANESIVEKGINILYITFGLLCWTDKDDKDYWLNSPLVLIPISLSFSSAQNIYQISEYEDEYTTNPALIYKLKNEYGIQIPEFRGDGFDNENLLDYFDRVREMFSEQKWSVKDEVKIGTFSFLKLDMYKDLKDNKEEVLKSEIVKKILDKDYLPEIFGDEVQSELQKDSEETRESDDNINKNLELCLHNVVDADSSQMSAILEAKNGHSFVLQGPPGTGKSQTITNLIAEFLYDDKKVLFVSEKLAALNVVYNNLKKVGLADFCLQLHSNKANKKEVIAELYRVLSLNKKNLSENAEQETALLKKYKNELDTYAGVLHKVIPSIGKTPYEILSLISKYKDVPSFEYIFSNIDDVDFEYISKCNETIELFESYSEMIGYDYRKNCWYGYNNLNINYQTKFEIKKQIDELNEFYLRFQKAINDVQKVTNIELYNYYLFNKNYEILKYILNISYFDSNIFKKSNLEKIIDLTTNCVNIKNEIENYEIEISNHFNENIYEIEELELYKKFTSEYNFISRLFGSGYKKDVASLKVYQKNANEKLKFSQIKRALFCLCEVKKLKEQLSKKIVELNGLFLTNKTIENFDLKEVLKEFSALNNILYSDFSGFETEKIDPNAIKLAIKTLVEYYENNKIEFEKISKLQDNFDPQIVHFEAMSFDEINLKLSGYLDNFDEFENWVRFSMVLDTLKNLRLTDFIEKSIDYNVKRETLHLTFLKMIYQQLIYQIIESTPCLAGFTRMTQDSIVSNFRKKDKLRFEISKAEIISKIFSKIPDVGSIASESQVSILVREANKKSKQKPVRTLFKEIDHLVKQLKPCFLMSPLSVSTYLDIDSSKFDVVIFDEASQIFPWDSIGAIARGKQVIIVGDSKQMPPSNFFTSGVNDNFDSEEDDDSLDFESILDLSSSVLSQKRLNWHYRSKNEELIVFSNANFYDGSLVTFPSAYKNRENVGVDFYYVKEGVFDRKTKTNRIEAEKVVDLVFEHFEKFPKRSLGVVAFSISQQSIIEQIIHERRMKDDKFAELFDENTTEPFFVKNLETVQGDERDTIIFSVAYAKDDDGKFYHNFGPLNKKGGERRLNVAVTRAKINIKLVASIQSYDIDLEKSSMTGTRLLKEYIEYAEKGADSFVQKDISFDEQLNQVENEIYEFLIENGFKAKKNIGCSEYKIDIGIQNLMNMDYVLAIECDGKNYKNAKCTRDRDRLRQEVLERLGWKFYRIWSIDWFLNKSVEKKKLLLAVENALKSYNEELEETQVVTSNLESEDNNSTFLIESGVSSDLKSLFKEYEEYDIYSKKVPTFENSIFDLVKVEAPITEEYLLRKVAPLFGREKITNVVREYFYENMKKFENKIFKINDFYVVDKNMLIQMRVPKENSEPRDIVYIPKIEIASGLFEVIKRSSGITKKGLFNTVAELLGYSRMGNNINQKFSEALDYLLSCNLIKQEDLQYFVN